ncbi:MAG: hypothetical protein HC907_05910 [Richelia sp. SM1_7_0]|nr:hypothetical protein [Richelia sp. SM1_7_0]
MVSSLPESQEDLQEKDIQRLERIRHSCAHLMAMAVQRLFPGTKVAIGPVTDTGFYYDFDCPVSITTDDLGKIEVEMRRIIKDNLPIIREEVEREEIKKEIAALNEPYKLEILERIPNGETITRYFIGIPDDGEKELSLFAVDNIKDDRKTVSDEVREYAELVARELHKEGLRVEVDSSGERLGKQIRNAELEKIPVVAVVGKREVENQTLSVRTRQAGDLGALSISETITCLQSAIALNSTI